MVKCHVEEIQLLLFSEDIRKELGRDWSARLKKEELLLTRLTEYNQSGAVPFHMPGHKRVKENDMLRSFPNPYSIDITEIDGFDNLHHPEGILKQSMEWAAGVYHTEHTYYLINGSSSGILSAISAAVRPGGKILMSRNCHKAAYHGVILNHLEPRYVYPQILEDMGIQGGISPSDVENILQIGPIPQAVLIVSPTYDGIVSDVKKIADIVHGYGIPLIVDEAHGAHFPFGGGVFPESAFACGADVVIQSLHKTLPSFTQTAVLHVQGERVDRERLERYLQMYQSSSPSYVFMAGIERCIYEMEQHGNCYMKDFAKRLEQVRERLSRMKHLKLMQKNCVGNASVFDMDMSKIVVSCRGCIVGITECRQSGSLNGLNGLDGVLTGERLSNWLRRQYHLEMEMSGADYVVAITTYLDDSERLERLTDALTEIDALIKRDELTETDRMKETNGAIVADVPEWATRKWSICTPEIRVNPAEAAEAEYEALGLEQCAGRISAEFIYLYPPGIPIVAPGELVTEEIVEQVQYYKKIGLPVQGMADRNSDKLRVLRRIKMGRIFYLMGKSASGKDTLYKKLMEECPELRTVVLYTTRPMRSGETDGVEYHFTVPEKLKEFQDSGRMIELRTYQTVCGPWSYATVDDGQIDLEQADYLTIGTLESYENMRNYYGEAVVVPLYVTVDDGLRLERALSRERMQEKPNYAELCRRFLADEEDFAPDNLKRLGIVKEYHNDNLETCMEEIKLEMKRVYTES